MMAHLLQLRLLETLLTGALQIDAGPQGILEIVWGGCIAENRGPECVTAAGKTLTLWTRQRGARSDDCDSSAITLAGRGHRTVATIVVDGGCSTQVEVEDAAGIIEIHGNDGRVLWSLQFTAEPVDAPGLVSPFSRARALDLDGRRAFQTGDFPAGLAAYTAARSLYEHLGSTSRACDISFSMAHWHWTERHDAVAATAALQDALPCVALIPRYTANYRYVLATLAEQSGDLLATRNLYHHLDAVARRVQDLGFEVAILAAQLDVAEQLHLRAEGDEIETRLIGMKSKVDLASSCGLANALTVLSWTMLLRRERGEPFKDPSSIQAAARDQYAPGGGCPSVDDFRNATINLALAALHRGDPGKSEALLVNLEDDPNDPEGEVWRHRILARAGLTRGNMKLARTHADALTALARRHADPYLAWHASVIRGEFSEESGDADAASAAYLLAEASRDEMMLPLALGAGRERLGADWEDSTRRLIRLQLDRGMPGAAMRTARLARRRALHTIFRIAGLDDHTRASLAAAVEREREATDFDARRDANRTVSQLERALAARGRRRVEVRRLFDAAVDKRAPASYLREPDAGELLLLFYPLGDHWIGFADDGFKVSVTTFTVPVGLSDEKLGHVLFDPFTAEITVARQIRILASAPLLERDLHALPHQGEPLLAHAAVVYSLDLDDPSPSTRLAAPRSISRGVVIAANPGGTVSRLKNVEQEAMDVEHEWTTLGLKTRLLSGPEANRRAVLDALVNADVLHFSGHNLARPEAAGSDHPWDLELVLELGTGLGVEDVMLLPAVAMPQVVVLSACATGRSDPRSVSGGVGIGPGFLLRGATLVVATTRLVSDSGAAQVAAALYGAAPDIAALMEPETLAEAQRELLAGGTCVEHRDVCAYRAWVR